MKNSFKIFLLTTIMGLTLNSCIEDVLDVEIPSSITSGNFPQQEGDLQAILTALYSNLRAELNRTTYGEDRGDALDVGLVGSVSDAWAQNLNGGNGPNWRANYNFINNINLIITASETINFNSDASKGEILGQAYFLRAFTYLRMVKIWGGVPLVLEPVDQNTPTVARSTAQQVMAQIFSDIDLSLASFVDEGFNSKYIASKPAAYALMADARMWSSKVLGGGDTDFQAAIDAVNSIQGVSLLSDFVTVFDTSANNEIIFAIFLDFTELDEAGDDDDLINMYASRVSVRDINLDPTLNPDVPTSASNNARSDYRPSDKIIALYENSDLRAARSFIPVLVPDGDDPGTDPDILSYAQNKFKGTNANADTFYDNDLIVYRWADMLLLRAEANAALNQIPQALVDLNLVRERAGLTPYAGALDKNSVELEILDERGRELFLELKRYWDLVRFHAGGTINIYNEVPNLQGLNIPLLWPVNDDVIAENNLIEQTPGYD